MKKKKKKIKCGWDYLKSWVEIFQVGIFWVGILDTSQKFPPGKFPPIELPLENATPPEKFPPRKHNRIANQSFN